MAEAITKTSSTIPALPNVIPDATDENKIKKEVQKQNIKAAGTLMDVIDHTTAQGKDVVNVVGEFLLPTTGSLQVTGRRLFEKLKKKYEHNTEIQMVDYQQEYYEIKMKANENLKSFNHKLEKKRKLMNKNVPDPKKLGVARRLSCMSLPSYLRKRAESDHTNKRVNSLN